MNLEDFYDMVYRVYQGMSIENMPMVLTIINPDGSVTAIEIDGAAILATGHPNGAGDRVTNLIVYPPR